MATPATPLVTGNALPVALQNLNVALAEIADRVQKLVKANKEQADSVKTLTQASVGISAVFGSMTTGIGQLQNITGLALHSIGQLTGAISANVASFVSLYSPVNVRLFQLALNDLHASIGRALVPLLERFVTVVRSIADVIASLTPTTRNMIAALVAAGVGMVALTVTTEAFSAVVASATGGLSLLFGAIAGGVASVAFVSKDLGSVQQAVQKIGVVGRQVFELLGTAFGRVVTAAGPLIDRVAALASSMVGPLTKFLETTVGTVAGLFEQLAPIFEQLAPVVAQALTALLQLSSGVQSLQFNLILGPILRLFGALVPVFSLLTAPLRVAASLLGTVAQVVGGVLGPALDLLLTPLKVFGEIAAALADTVGQAVADLQDAFSEVGALARDIGSIIMELSAEVMKALKPLIRELAGEFVGALKLIVSGIRELAAWIKDTVGLIRELLGIEEKPQENPAGASEGLAVREVHQGSLEEAIRRAQASAFIAGRPPEEKPEVKAVGHLANIEGYVKDIKDTLGNLPTVLGNLLQGGANAALGIQAPDPTWAAREAVRAITG